MPVNKRLSPISRLLGAALLAVLAVLAQPGWARPRAAVAGEQVAVPEPPEPPVPPAIPTPPATIDFGPPTYEIAAGKTHTGDLRLFNKTVRIAGAQDGDILFFGQSIDLPGKAHGRVKAICSAVAIGGTVEGPVTAYCASFELKGTIDGDLDARCGTVVLASGSKVTGDVEAYGGQLVMKGSIGGDLKAAGGEIVLDAQVARNAELHADVLRIAPTSKIAGNLAYTSRTEIEEAIKKSVGGSVDRDHEARTVEIEEHRVVRHHHVARWFGLTILGMLVGLGALALFKRPAASVIAATRREPLRNLGVGFLATIVLPVALVLSCILILTIPFAGLAMVAFLLAVYVAKLPVAVWGGDWLLRRLGRRDPSTYASAATGLLLLYLLFAIPVLGWIIWFAVVFLGLGGMIFGIRDHWAARRRAPAGFQPTEGSPPDIAPPSPTSGPPTTAV